MINVHSQGQHILVGRDDPVLALTWPEANELQAKLRSLLIDNAITLRDT